MTGQYFSPGLLVAKLVFFLVGLFLWSATCIAQGKRLVAIEDIEDWTTTRHYFKLITSDGTQPQWKPEFAFMDSIQVSRLTYTSDGLKVNGFVVKPKQPGNYPCIIYNRGGNRDFGTLEASTVAILLGKLSQAGYVVVASQYRGNGGSEGKEEFGGKDVNDVLALIDLLPELEGVDTTRIGMYGWSRGGMMTYLALTKTPRIKAAVVGGANSDLTRIDRPTMEANVYAELIPDYSKNKQAALEARSAVYWADKFPKSVPILLLHGSSDWRVKASNSLNLALEFEKHRIPYRLKIYEGADHGIREHRSDVEREVQHWFDRFLKENETLPNTAYHGR